MLLGLGGPWEGGLGRGENAGRLGVPMPPVLGGANGGAIELDDGGSEL